MVGTFSLSQLIRPPAPLKVVESRKESVYGPMLRPPPPRAWGGLRVKHCWHRRGRGAKGHTQHP